MIGTHTLTRQSSSVEVKEVGYNEENISMCYYQGNTYLGRLDNGVCKVEGNTTTHLITLSGDCGLLHIRAYKEKLYAMTVRKVSAGNDTDEYQLEFMMRVYNMDGEELFSWSLFTIAPIETDQQQLHVIWQLRSMFTTYRDYLYIPSKETGSINIWDLDGNLVTSLDWRLADDFSGLAATQTGNLIITQLQDKAVKCVTRDTGEEVWRVKLEVTPVSVAVDQSTGLVYVLAMSPKNSARKVDITVKILSSETGKFILL